MRRSTVLSALGGFALAGASTARAQTAATIRLASAPNDQATGILYAQSAGLFAKAGLDVQVVRMRSGSAIAAAVSGGTLDLGISNIVSLALAHVRGIPYQMIAPTTLYRADYHPDEGLLVLANSGIRSPKDLIGKVVSVSTLKDIFTLSLYAWLDQNGVDAGQVKFLEIPPDSSADALLQGRIDAAIMFQPFMEVALDTKKFRVLAYPLTAIGPRIEVAAIFGTSAWIDGHRDAVDRFNHAVLEGSRFVAAHERESAPLIAKFSGVELDRVLKTPRPSRAFYLEPATLQPLIDAMARYKFIPNAFNVQDMISPAALRPR